MKKVSKKPVKKTTTKASKKTEVMEEDNKKDKDTPKVTSECLPFGDMWPFPIEELECKPGSVYFSTRLSRNYNLGKKEQTTITTKIEGNVLVNDMPLILKEIQKLKENKVLSD